MSATIEQAMGSDGGGDHASTNPAAVRISSEILVAAVIFLFMVVVIVFFLYLYAKRYLRYDRSGAGSRFVFAASDLLPSATRRGLDPGALASLPVTVYRSADFEGGGGLECAVCLSELTDGEEARVLPKCGHGFHLQCIDMWFHSHDTCPLCRCAVVAGEPSSPRTESPNPPPPEATPTVFPTNVLIWGGQDRVNERVLAIEIPRNAADGLGPQTSPLPSSREAQEELRSPVSATFRTLRRLWSQGRRAGAGPSSFSPREVDVEQGPAEEIPTPPPKAPAPKA
ncbi:RING-H2 finger protein ATL3-like [Curcuma longa]|uniref:RING-H2 finger protein ATL3-like n=1 Tax=Curcuma longa TaxID=136217 RepID=UPI003D9E0557